MGSVLLSTYPQPLLRIRRRFFSVKDQVHPASLPGIIDLHQDGADETQASSSFGKIPTTLVRRWTSQLTLSNPLVVRIRRRWAVGKAKTVNLFGMLVSSHIANLEAIFSYFLLAFPRKVSVEQVFSGQEMKKLYTDLDKVNAFRNTRVTHVETRLDNADEAWEALTKLVCMSQKNV